MMSRRSMFAVLALGLALAPATFATASAADWSVLRKIPLGGEGGWDYTTADAAARRLYVSRSTHVMVVSLDTDSLVGDIPDTPGVHGIALAPALGRGFTSNGRDSSVTVFDIKTLAVLQRVKLPARNPDAILFDPATARVFTFNGGSNNACAIDAKTGEVLATIALDGRPEFGATDGKGRVYVNLEDSSAVVAIDAKTLKPVARWPLAPGEGPSGLAIDAAHGRLFSTCHNNQVVVLDAKTGARVATVPIGSGVDAGFFDPGSQTAFASCGDGTLAVIHEDAPDRFTKLADVPTQRGARTMAFDAKTGRVWLPTAEFGPPPEPTPDNPRPRPRMVPGSFTLVVVGH